MFVIHLGHTVGDLLDFVDRKLKERRRRKIQRECRHSIIHYLNEPYSWCVRCGLVMPSESVLFLTKAGRIRPPLWYK